MTKNFRSGFDLFKRSPGALMVQRMIGVDISRMEGWRQMADSFQSRMNGKGWETTSAAFRVASTGEACLMAAILSSMNNVT